METENFKYLQPNYNDLCIQSKEYINLLLPIK